MADPHGVLAVWCYTRPVLEGELDAIVLRYYAENCGAYWPADRKLVDEGYRSIPIPIDEVVAPPLNIESHLSLAEFGGYVRTWSATNRLAKAIARDPVVDLEDELRARWGETASGDWFDGRSTYAPGVCSGNVEWRAFIAFVFSDCPDATRSAGCRRPMPFHRGRTVRASSSITRTHDELSIVCADDVVPRSTECVRGYVAMRVEGTLAPELVGILVSLAKPLADAGIPILAIGTHDTDYVLVREADLERAVGALQRVGHEVDTHPGITFPAK